MLQSSFCGVSRVPGCWRGLCLSWFALSHHQAQLLLSLPSAPPFPRVWDFDCVNAPALPKPGMAATAIQSHLIVVFFFLNVASWILRTNKHCRGWAGAVQSYSVPPPARPALPAVLGVSSPGHDTSHQILFCSLILVLEACQSLLRFSSLRVDDILLPWYIFYSFIVLVPKNSGWRILLLKKCRVKHDDTDLWWKRQRRKVIMLGYPFYSYMVLGSVRCRARVKQSSCGPE